MSGASPSIIERREYKFLIDRSRVAAVRNAVLPFCVIDPFAARSPTRTYTIETLYLDTDDLSLFWANDHEQVDRIKMRIRRYADKPNSPVYFEVKRRVNDLISKSRGRVPPELWKALVADDAARLPDEIVGKDRMAVERFLSLARTLHLRPYTLVRYQREPYISTIDDYARVTFDTWIQAHTINHLSFEPDGGRWRALDDAVMQRTRDSLVVLELKFTNHVPLWLVNLTRSLGLVRGAYSKYGNSIKAFYQPVDIRTPRFVGGWP
jgi:VTC domain